MKKLIAIVLLVMSAGWATAQNQGTRYMFTGELLNVPTMAPNCGTMAFATVFEFKVTMISDDTYTAQNIAIVIKCPESFGPDFFKQGAIYKMELFDEIGTTNYTISNSEVLNTYNLAHNYWAGDAKRVK